ncbi:MAG: hypothetical protein HY751_10750 [Nitrospinae bacterium]|nr:hypothetical protein [Nitrospinota bacterium]
MEICDRCGVMIQPGDVRYMVKVTVKVDDGGVINQPISEEEMKNIIDQLSTISSDELEKQVYEERSFILCPTCKRAFMDRPFGDSLDRPPGDWPTGPY